jgi:membrane peptidoglycan carboxypeptidase
MRDLHYIKPEQALAASRSALGLRITTVRSGCEAPGVTAPFFCDYVRRYLELGPAGAALGSTRQERQEALLAGGLTIRTTLDAKVQRAAQKAVDEGVPRKDPSGVAAVADVVEPGTGEVRAMAVDRGFGSRKGETKVNLAIGGSLGFQGGSTFKVFTLARAMQIGISPQLTLYAPRSYCPKAYDYKLADGGCPGNAGDSESGRFTLVKATWESVNTYFLQLAERTGLDAPIGLAEAMGVRRVSSSFEGARLKHEGSFVLGAPTVSPLTMAAAYATFPAHGQYCAPSPITSISDSQGKEVSLPTSPCSQVMEPDTADAVTSILRGVIDGPARLRTGRAASLGRPAAGKTGTTNESKAAWFVGYTPQLATAVWVGNPRRPTPMRGITINGRHYAAVYGGSLPAPIWKQVMQGALEGVPVENFSAPAKLDTGTKVAVPDVRGLTTEAATDQLRALGFGVTVAGPVNGGPVPAGVVAWTSPPARSSVPAGTTVTLFPSNGRAPVVVVTPNPTPTTPGTGPPSPGPSSTPPPPGPTPTKKHGH